MQRITRKQIEEYVGELGEYEKEHRKYSSFYCSATYTIHQDDVDTLADEGIDASELLDVTITLTGTWDDSWGAEWTNIDFAKHEAYQEFVPEVIIPAHYETKYRAVQFTMTFQ